MKDQTHINNTLSGSAHANSHKGTSPGDLTRGYSDETVRGQDFAGEPILTPLGTGDGSGMIDRPGMSGKFYDER